MKRIALIIMLAWMPMLGFSQGCDAPSEDGVNLFGFIQPQYDYLFDDIGSNRI